MRPTSRPRRRGPCRAALRVGRRRCSKRQQATSSSCRRVAVPDWARQPAPPEARPPRPLAPSAIAVDDESAPAAERGHARRGAARHLDPPAARAACPRSSRQPRRPLPIAGWKRSAGVADAAVRGEIVDQVCGILSDPRFAGLFGAGSLGEAPLAATLPDGRVIAGTVDRLLRRRRPRFR